MYCSHTLVLIEVYTSTMPAGTSAQALFLRCRFALQRTTAANCNSRTSNAMAMKRPCQLVITVLCLLTLLLNTASCLHAQLPHPQHDASCGDCPRHAPATPNAPACCIAHQQPSTAATSVEVEQPAHLPNAFAPIAPNLPAPALFSAATRLSAPPLVPPIIALRI
jgi:hypothetical protein